MKKTIALLGVWLLMMACVQLSAQTTRLVSGTVLNENGAPIEGASVIEKGTINGTTTNSTGEFSIRANPSSILQFSYVGYDPVEMPIGQRDSINVVLLTRGQLDSVVVVGYGTQKKETVTGAIATVKAKELIESPVANISNSLVGRVAGLSATQASGEPGDNVATLRIRGVGTINGSGQDPLIIIDGVESSSQVMNAIDPHEVENISVLKDASSTAVYGVRGANGVIIVTTRRGTLGTPKVSLSYNYGFNQLATRMKMLGSYEYALFRNEAIMNDGLTDETKRLLFSEQELWKFQANRDYTPDEVEAMNISDEKKQALLNSPALYYSNHDYVDEQFGGRAPQSQVNLNITGGGNKVKYFTSVGYFTQGGVFKQAEYAGANVNSYYKRYNFRSNFDFDLIRNFNLKVDIAARMADNGGVLGNQQDGPVTGSYGRHKAMMGTIFASPPFAGPGIVDGKLVGYYVENTNPMIGKGGGAYSAHTDLLARPFMESINTNLNANVRLKHTMNYITKGLSLGGAVSYNDTYVKNRWRRNPVPIYSIMRDPQNPAEFLFFGGAVGPNELNDNYGNYKWRRVYVETSLDYNMNFDKHSVSALYLLNAQKTFDPGFQYQVPSGLMGMVGRTTYKYDDRYIAEVNLGYNGSENFPPGKRFGFFPAYSLGWIVTNEKFLPENDILSYLKIRGSYGVVGNDKIGGRRFLYLPTTWGYGSENFLGGYYFGNTNGSSRDPYYTGAMETSIGNPNVTWERAKKANIGLEMNLFKNRLSFVGDIFSEKRDNILWPIGTLPVIMGGSFPPDNIGKVSNKGYEAQLGWNDNVNEFTYGLKFNLAYAKNKIEYYAEPLYPYSWMNTTGYSIGQYRGYVSDGFYNTPEEVAQHINSNFDGNKVQLGDLRYKDINSDGRLDEKDMVPIGYSNYPRYNFSSILNFGFKGLSLSVLFTGAAQGSMPLSDLYLRNPFYLKTGSAMQFQYDGRWTPEKVQQGITPTFPRASYQINNTINGLPSDFWLMSTDFIRLKNVELSYNFTNIGFLKKLYMSSVRVYANGNNLYTWSKLLPGFDPEQQDSGGASGGYLYPMTQVYNFGINVQF